MYINNTSSAYLFLEGKGVGYSGVLDLAAGGRILLRRLLLLAVVLRDLALFVQAEETHKRTKEVTHLEYTQVGYCGHTYIHPCSSWARNHTSLESRHRFPA